MLPPFFSDVEVPVPKVVIVGRPNVGKSSIFNWLAGQRIAIVDPTCGVTRDRVSHLVAHQERYFELVDTGGMGIEDADGLTDEVERQIDIAIGEATMVLFVVDAHTGTAALDELVAKRLRALDKPIVCVANKCDTDKFQSQAAADFYRFGHKLLFVSVVNNRNKVGLLEEICRGLPAEMADVEPTVAMNLAVVGKRNAGKSTFINCLAESERMIVSEVPGTTRDSVDVRFEHHGQAFVAIDTAGVRRARSLEGNIEFYSYTRAQRTIRRADVVLLFIDPTTRLSKVDKQLAHYIVEHYKPCVFVVNKWDLMAPMPTGQYSDYIDSLFPMLQYAPRVFVTANRGRNVQALVDLSQSLFRQARERVPTADVNRVINAALAHKPPPVRRNKRPKIYYATQVATAPPTIVLFCNQPQLFEPTYERYLLNVCRDELPFAEVPIRLCLRKRDSHLPRKEDALELDSAADEPATEA